MTQHVTAFIDTNTFLHYQSLNQIDWLKILNADSVSLVILPVVIRELTKHKDQHPSKKIRERAASSIKLLQTIHKKKQDKLQDKISLIFIPNEANINFDDFMLNRETADDLLIAGIIAYRNEHPTATMKLITADIGLQIKAEHHSIEADALKDSFKLPDEPDPNELQIRTLQQELSKIKNAQPKLKLAFSDGSDKLDVKLQAYKEITPERIDSIIEEICNKNPKHNINEKLIFSMPLTNIMGVSTTITAVDVIQYNNELDIYYADYRKYLENLVETVSLPSRKIILEIVLYNNGTSPAEDIDVHLHFPDGFELYTEDYTIKIIDEPTPPEGPLPQSKKQRVGLTPNFPNISLSIPSNLQKIPNFMKPTIKRTNSFIVDFLPIKKLKHNCHEEFDKLYVVFSSPKEASSFHVDYEIRAANIPDMITGKLHVIVEIGEVPTEE